MFTEPRSGPGGSVRRRFSTQLVLPLAALLAAVTLAAVFGGCGNSQGRKAARADSASERKLETLMGLLMDVERRGAGDEDSAAVEAQRIIDELGGPDPTAKLLAESTLRDAERWIPFLDSLAHMRG